jgi:hypothetical protein
MQAAQIKTLDTARRVQGFLDAQAAGRRETVLAHRDSVRRAQRRQRSGRGTIGLESRDIDRRGGNLRRVDRVPSGVAVIVMQRPGLPVDRDLCMHRR